MPETAAQTAAVDSRPPPLPFDRRSWFLTAVVSGTHPLLLLRLSHGGDQIIELPIQHLIHAVRREMDAMVGHTILRKVVRADLLRAVAGPHLRAPLARTRRLLLRHHAIEQARAQDLHRLDLVLQLRLLILALHFE